MFAYEVLDVNAFLSRKCLASP